MLPDRLLPGESLGQKGRLFAPNGQAFLAAQSDGNVVLYRTSDGASLWSTGQVGVSRFVFQRDGNIVGYDGAGNPVWASNTDSHPNPQGLILQNDGNLVALDANGNPYWDSGTNGFVGTRSGNRVSDLNQLYDHVSDAVDEAKALINQIPGMSWATELIQDFANTGVGKAFFRIVSPLAVPILWTIPFVGPVVAQVAWAFPGLARGEPLVTAYANEIRAAAAQVGADILKDELPAAAEEAELEARDVGKLAGEFPKDVADTISKMGAKYGLPSPVNISDLANAFAGSLGIRQDLARVALDQVLGLDPFTDNDGTNPLYGHFDAETGNEKKHVNAHAALAFLAAEPQKAVSAANARAVLGTLLPVKTTGMRAVVHALSTNPAMAKALGLSAPVTSTKATAATNLAHDALAGRPKAESYASSLVNGGGVDGAAMNAAAIQAQRLLTRKFFVDKYTRGTT